ncbi:hypothetical protein [Sphingobacterium sp. JB170]|uniref:hypothetical protein n=1 Tax=Sphingobacterium sp. JB170 TaxID=1434842 RepID=UPI00097F4464|nr:hypothetical protein [Sphingobacterium sp. JB170]SJN47689.1 hypothetical protein FM107_16000 [Sphingobacterium sp. JB170]
MIFVEITKDKLISAKANGFNAIVTSLNSDPINPIWFFEKVPTGKFQKYQDEIANRYQICYPLSEAIETIDELPFIGKLKIEN